MEDTGQPNYEEQVEQLKPKRYAVTTQFYLYASDLVSANAMAAEFTRQQDLKNDDKCSVYSVELAEWASLRKDM